MGKFLLFHNKNKKKISTICDLENIQELVIDGDLITLQLNEGVIYMGQIVVIF